MSTFTVHGKPKKGGKYSKMETRALRRPRRLIVRVRVSPAANAILHRFQQTVFAMFGISERNGPPLANINVFLHAFNGLEASPNTIAVSKTVYPLETRMSLHMPDWPAETPGTFVKPKTALDSHFKQASTYDENLQGTDPETVLFKTVANFGTSEKVLTNTITTIRPIQTAGQTNTLNMRVFLHLNDPTGTIEEMATEFAGGIYVQFATTGRKWTKFDESVTTGAYVKTIAVEDVCRIFIEANGTLSNGAMFNMANPGCIPWLGLNIRIPPELTVPLREQPDQGPQQAVPQPVMPPPQALPQPRIPAQVPQQGFPLSQPEPFGQTENAITGVDPFGDPQPATGATYSPGGTITTSSSVALEYSLPSAPPGFFQVPGYPSGLNLPQPSSIEPSSFPFTYVIPPAVDAQGIVDQLQAEDDDALSSSARGSPTSPITIRPRGNEALDFAYDESFDDS